MLMIKDTFLKNDFDQTLAFNCLPFNHFVQEVNVIWYPGSAIINLLRDLISLTSYTKWRNGK